MNPVITFDDGHISNLELALPLLEAHAMRAHFFITVGWTGQKRGFMNWSELRTLLSSGQKIGAHGWSHTLLTHCSDAELEQELRIARLRLEDGIGAAVRTMSLPGGRSNRRVLEACRAAGYEHVFTSVPTTESRSFSFTIGRMNISGDLETNRLARFFDPQSDALMRLNRKHRIKEAAKRALGDQLYSRLWSVLVRHEADADEAAH